jgi:hypothetical protein
MWGAFSDERTDLPFTIYAVLASTVILRSFTVSDLRLPQPGGPGPRIYIPQEHDGPVIPPSTGFPFRRLLRLARLRWRYSNPPPRGRTANAKVKITLRLTVSQSVSPGVEPRLDIYYSLTVTVLFFWGSLYDERRVYLLYILLSQI